MIEGFAIATIGRLYPEDALGVATRGWLYEGTVTVPPPTPSPTPSAPRSKSRGWPISEPTTVPLSTVVARDLFHALAEWSELTQTVSETIALDLALEMTGATDAEFVAALIALQATSKKP